MQPTSLNLCRLHEKWTHPLDMSEKLIPSARNLVSCRTQSETDVCPNSYQLMARIRGNFVLWVIPYLAVEPHMLKSSQSNSRSFFFCSLCAPQKAQDTSLISAVRCLMSALKGAVMPASGVPRLTYITVTRPRREFIIGCSNGSNVVLSLF